ncbi:peptidoglycan-recognition protein SB1-like [Macrosteles quadrilineatus]|uniref:peptidoglycan-recognition protein SB1-like n=1 Tax=Macrosteles quadrilineatus TaxID=74068 RepID=UPI0023E0C765|nr:peptidoglycan-recognition protein SB1-like [Macrosteles quadrilineatus]
MPKDMALEVVPRAKWGALPPKNEGVELEHPIEFIWLRSEPEMRPCLTQEKCIKACQTLQKRDMEAPKCIDINANFIIGDDGRIYEGRGLFVKPRKSKEFPKYDGEYIEIVYIGPLDDCPEEPNGQRVYNLVFDIIEYAVPKRYMIEEVAFLGDPPPWLK